MPSDNVMIEFDHHADLFPMMSPEQHNSLVASIKSHGLLHPIVLYEGKIVDGRNRFAACRDAGVEPHYTELPAGTDVLAYVVGTNLVRRHLSESQRALAAARIEEHSVSRESAGKMFKVRVSSLKQAEIVLKHCAPELVAAVEEDRIPVNIASKLSSMPAAAQREACELKPQELRGIVKKHTRIKKTVALVKATRRASEALGEALYSVIYADPPWRFEPWSPSGMDRAADNHYPTETTDTIMAMKVPSAANCILFLWATNPMLEDALAVLHAWGFTYKSNFVWNKDQIGTGFWNRNKHELLLIGTRGSVPAPDASDRVDSVIDAPTGEHSVKPDAFRSLIEQWYPTLPKIELFAREHFPGWAAHGNELPDLPGVVVHDGTGGEMTPEAA